MNWYAIQVLTGKEQQVIDALIDYGAAVIQPQVPSFLKSGGKLCRHATLKITTDKIMPQITEWQARSLESVYIVSSISLDATARVVDAMLCVKCGE